jgi:periplasmic protein TonB
MNFQDYNFDDEVPVETLSFWKRYRYYLIGGLTLSSVLGATLLLAPKRDNQAAPRKAMEAIIAISAPPPPPPPVAPPPPAPPEPQEQEMLKQEEIVEEAPEEAPSEEMPDVSATATGSGGVDFGLRKGAGGTGQKRIIGSGRKAGKYDSYARGLQSSITEAMRRHPRVQKAKMALTVRIWADQSGRVTRAALTNTTGDAALDTALSKEVLTGMQLHAPPPADMPMPVVLQIRATRPQ